MNSERLEIYISQALSSFQSDPPSSAFQRGYLAAIKDLKEFVETDLDTFNRNTQRIRSEEPSE